MSDKLNTALFGSEDSELESLQSAHQTKFAKNQYGVTDFTYNPNESQVYQQLETNLYTTSSVMFTSKNHCQKEDMQDMINQIPFPQDDDISVTSFSDNSNDTTPQKYMFKGKKQFNKNANETQDENKLNQYKNCFINVPHMQDLTISQMSYTENLTPHQSTINEWNKQHVNPNSKMLFPSVIAPSIDFTIENSQNLNLEIQILNKEKDKENNPFIGNIYNENDEQNISYTSKVSRQTQQSQITKQTSYQQIVQKNVVSGQKKINYEIILSRNQDLEKEFKSNQKNLQQLTQELQFLGQRISELEEKNIFLCEKHKDKSSLDSLRGKQLENSKTQIQQLQSQNDKKDQKITQLQQQITQFNNKEKVIENAIEKELTELYGEIEKQKVVITTYSKQVQKLERTNIEAKKYNQQEISENSKRVQSLNNQIEQLLNERNEMQDKQQKKHQSVEQLLQIQKEFQENIQIYEENEIQNQKIIKELKQKIEISQQNNYKEIKLTSDKQKDEMSQKLIDEISRQKQSYEKQINRLKEQIQTKKEEDTITLPGEIQIKQEIDLQDYKQKNNELETKLKDIQSKYGQQNCQIQLIKNEKSILEMQQKNAQENIDNMQDQLRQNQDYKLKIKELQDQIQKLQGKNYNNKEYESNILKNYQINIDKLQEQIHEFEKQNEILIKENEQLKKKFQQQKSINEQNQQEQKIIENLFSEKQLIFNEKQEKIEELSNLVLKLQDQLNQHVQDKQNRDNTDQKYKNQIEIYKMENQQLANTLQEFKEKNEKIISNQKEQVNNKQKTIEKQLQLIKEKEQINSELSIKLKNKQDLYQKLEENLRKTQQELKEQLQQEEEIIQKYNELKSIMEDNEPQQQQFQDYQNLYQELQDHDNEFQQMKEIYSKNMHDMSQRLIGLESDNQVLCKENEYLNKEISKKQNITMHNSNVLSGQKSNIYQIEDFQLSQSGFNQKNLYKQQQKDDFQPEMLSNEETVQFMIMVMRRVIQSSEMVSLLLKSEDFRQLVNTVQNENSFYLDENKFKFSSYNSFGKEEALRINDFEYDNNNLKQSLRCVTVPSTSMFGSGNKNKQQTYNIDNTLKQIKKFQASGYQ